MAATQLRRDLLADSAAFGSVFAAIHDELHATCLAGPILSGTVLAKRSPLVVSALEESLVEKAHFDMAKLQVQMSATSEAARIYAYLRLMREEAPVVGTLRKVLIFFEQTSRCLACGMRNDAKWMLRGLMMD